MQSNPLLSTPGKNDTANPFFHSLTVYPAIGQKMGKKQKFSKAHVSPASKAERNACTFAFLWPPQRKAAAFCRVVMNEPKTFFNGPNTEPWRTVCTGREALTTGQSSQQPSLMLATDSALAGASLKKLSCTPFKINYTKLLKLNTQW